MNSHNMIRVLHLNKSGLGNIELVTTMEHMETKEIHDYVLNINK
jgi:hypothetical protein